MIPVTAENRSAKAELCTSARLVTASTHGSKSAGRRRASAALMEWQPRLESLSLPVPINPAEARIPLEEYRTAAAALPAHTHRNMLSAAVTSTCATPNVRSVVKADAPIRCDSIAARIPGAAGEACATASPHAPQCLRAQFALAPAYCGPNNPWGASHMLCERDCPPDAMCWKGSSCRLCGRRGAPRPPATSFRGAPGTHPAERPRRRGRRSRVAHQFGKTGLQQRPCQLRASARSTQRLNVSAAVQMEV